jgi:hypothetical protein
MWFLILESKSNGRGTSEPSGRNFKSFKNQHMKKRKFISTGAAPKTLRLNVEKVVIGENPKNKSGFSYALVMNKQAFTGNLLRLVRSYGELPGSLIVSVQNQAGTTCPIAIIHSDVDLRSAVLSHRVSNPEWCLQKMAQFQCSIIVFQPAKVG